MCIFFKHFKVFLFGLLSLDFELFVYLQKFVVLNRLAESWRNWNFQC